MRTRQEQPKLCLDYRTHTSCLPTPSLMETCQVSDCACLCVYAFQTACKSLSSTVRYHWLCELFEKHHAVSVISCCYISPEILSNVPMGLSNNVCAILKKWKHHQLVVYTWRWCVFQILLWLLNYRWLFRKLTLVVVQWLIDRWEGCPLGQQQNRYL